MVKFISKFVGVLSAVFMLSACSTFVSDEDSAKKLFKAIANDDPHAFNWITAEEVEKLDGKNKEMIAKLKSFASDIDKNVPPLLAEWRQLGQEVGIDWQDIIVDSVMTMTDYDANYSEDLGIEASEGYIMATSNEKKFKIRFEQVILFNYDDGWRTVALTNFLPLDENGFPISNMTLKQDGTFDEFYMSLAQCFQKEAMGEVNKIFLTNSKGEKVFQIDPTYKDTWDEHWDFLTEGLRKNFVKTIEKKYCIADEMNYAMLLEYGMIDRFGLDEDEIMNHSQLWKVETNVEKLRTVGDVPFDYLGGKFMKYKGKWYYIGDFDSAYEH